MLTIMVLTTEEKVFIAKHYFQASGVGRQNRLSLHHVREHYKEQFNKTAPSNKTILAIVENFHCTGSVLCQWKGTTGHPRTVTTNENHERLLQQMLQSPKHSLPQTSLKLGVSDRSVRWMFRELGGFAYRIQVVQRLTEMDMGSDHSIVAKCRTQISSVTNGFQMKVIFTLMATSTDN